MPCLFGGGQRVAIGGESSGEKVALASLFAQKVEDFRVTGIAADALDNGNALLGGEFRITMGGQGLCGDVLHEVVVGPRKRRPFSLAPAEVTHHLNFQKCKRG